MHRFAGTIRTGPDSRARATGAKVVNERHKHSDGRFDAGTEVDDLTIQMRVNGSGNHAFHYISNKDKIACLLAGSSGESFVAEGGADGGRDKHIINLQGTVRKKRTYDDSREVEDATIQLGEVGCAYLRPRVGGDSDFALRFVEGHGAISVLFTSASKDDATCARTRSMKKTGSRCYVRVEASEDQIWRALDIYECGKVEDAIEGSVVEEVMHSVLVCEITAQAFHL